MMTDTLTCSHCGAEVTREELEDSFDEGDDFVVCPYCKGHIREDDIKTL